ncbi:hypothetical protein Y1Q_0010136 [Alligator mississippiensis]|uniref:Uncharacterized protein n=1 Tax=Alligator mississippiensis TaxID=8496 RepID=A0A151NG13_ALLMI|nr:hypothetical protein Y1Q_0010136 [Alligator mississippiensis]
MSNGRSLHRVGCRAQAAAVPLIDVNGTRCLEMNGANFLGDWVPRLSSSQDPGWQLLLLAGVDSSCVLSQHIGTPVLFCSCYKKCWRALRQNRVQRPRLTARNHVETSHELLEKARNKDGVADNGSRRLPELLNVLHTQPRAAQTGGNPALPEASRIERRGRKLADCKRLFLPIDSSSGCFQTPFENGSWSQKLTFKFP